MCELLGMSANVPTDMQFSLVGFFQRGGNTGPHKDGWGVGFYQDQGYREFKDPQPSISSPVAKLLLDYPIKSKVLISHIRQANVGAVNLGNTHPFTRELWGQQWCYAHNGQLEGFKETLPLGCYQPIGTTDSEWAFCWLMNQLKESFNQPPEVTHLAEKVHQLALKIQQLGVTNLLISNGSYLFAFCTTKLAYITRCAPFGPAQLKDADVTIDFSSCTTEKDLVSVIATQPLTSNENWHLMNKGDLAVFKDGELLSYLETAVADIAEVAAC